MARSRSGTRGRRGPRKPPRRDGAFASQVQTIDPSQRGPIELPGTTRLATDDWPYIYLEEPAVPVLYFLLAGVLALLFARGARKLGISGVASGWGRGGTRAVQMPSTSR